MIENRGMNDDKGSLIDKFTVLDLASDVNNILESMGLKKTYIIGSSMGSMVALEFSRMYPEKIGALILSSLPVQKTFLLKSFVDDPAFSPETFSPHSFLKKFFMNVFSSDFLKGDRFRLIDEFLLKDTTGISKKGLYYQLSAASEWIDSQDWSNRCTCPSFFIYGSEDKLVPLDSISSNNIFESAEIAFIPKAGHAVHIEKHREFNKLVYQFLEKQTGGLE